MTLPYAAYIVSYNLRVYTYESQYLRRGLISVLESHARVMPAWVRP